LLNHQDARQEALARNSFVTDLASKSASLAADIERIARNFTETKDHTVLDDVIELSPEDLYKLTKKIIDNNRDEHGVAKLQSSSLAALLRNSKIPATTISSSSIKPVTQKGKDPVLS